MKNLIGGSKEEEKLLDNIKLQVLPITIQSQYQTPVLLFLELSQAQYKHMQPGEKQ